MTREEAKAIIRKEYLCVDRDCDIERSCGKCDLMMPSKEPILKAYEMAIKALSQECVEPTHKHVENALDMRCDDAISRQAVLDRKYVVEVKNMWHMTEEIEVVNVDDIKALPSVKPQEPYDFAKWVASEIFDDMWEYNKDSFAEIACRKLEKLGIVRAKGDEWELIESEDKE